MMCIFRYLVHTDLIKFHYLLFSYNFLARKNLELKVSTTRQVFNLGKVVYNFVLK